MRAQRRAAVKRTTRGGSTIDECVYVSGVGKRTQRFGVSDTGAVQERWHRAVRVAWRLGAMMAQRPLSKGAT
jgi:hypothetical protein